MRQFIAALQLAILASPTFASDEERSTAMLQAMAPWDQVYFGLDARDRAAQAVWEYWDHFNSRLPRIAPDERAWLMQEMDTSDTQRLNRVFASEIYHLWNLERIVDACLENTTGVLGNLGGELEMYYWVQLGTCFDDHSELNRSLQAADLSNGRYDGPFDLIGLSIIHDEILERFAPSAMADVMGWTLE